jgi:hypothetical protein
MPHAHGGWKPGNASRYSRFNLTSVFNLSKGMVAFHDVPPPAGAGDGVTAETAIDAEAHDPPRDLAVDAIFNIDELGDMRWETGADGASDEDVAALFAGKGRGQAARAPSCPEASRRRRGKQRSASPRAGAA